MDGKNESSIDANQEMRKNFYNERQNITVEKPNQSKEEKVNNDLDEAFQKGERSTEVITHRLFIP